MEPQDKPLADPKDKVILIVDDDENVRNFLELTAMSEGFQVVTACDGAEAMQRVANRPPDLIITDLMMPGEGGYEFLRRLQGSEQGAIPVFVITASQINDSTAEMIRREANVVSFIRKPVPMAVFAVTLHKYLGTAPKKV
jgi:CheY-like chemotaxis protein